MTGVPVIFVFCVLPFADFGAVMDRRIDLFSAGEPELRGLQIVLQYP